MDGKTAFFKEIISVKVLQKNHFLWHMKHFLSFLFAEIPSRKFMFFYALRNEFLRSENEFHRFLFNKKMNLPEKTGKFIPD